MQSESVDGVKSGSAGADPLAVWIRNGQSDGGVSYTSHTLGSTELPVVELGLLGTGGSEEDRIPSGDPGGMAHGETQMVPRLAEDRGEVSLLPLFVVSRGSCHFSESNLEV